jgi:hypothetical protein
MALNLATECIRTNLLDPDWNVKMLDGNFRWFNHFLFKISFFHPKLPHPPHLVYYYCVVD